jgi:hypothetical protein
MADLIDGTNNVTTFDGTIGGGSSLLVAENRLSVEDTSVVDYMGNKDLTMFTVDFDTDASGEVGANEAIQAVIEIIGKYATIVIRGALFDTDSQMCFAIETPNLTEDWDNDVSATKVALVEQIEDEIILLGATYGKNNFDMTAVTCTVKTTFQLA